MVLVELMGANLIDIELGSMRGRADLPPRYNSGGAVQEFLLLFPSWSSIQNSIHTFYQIRLC